MNFTSKTKKEILAQCTFDACCNAAALAAFIRTTGTFSIKSGVIQVEITTESKNIAQFFIDILQRQYGANIFYIGDKSSATTFGFAGDAALNVLVELGIIEKDSQGLNLKLHSDKYLTENTCCALSYIKGAYLGSGSCRVPQSRDKANGYHLEFIFNTQSLAKNLQDLIYRFDISTKITVRKDKYIVYIKSAQIISDLFALMGASRAVLDLTDVVVKKTRSNDINRAVNCQTGNLTKQFDATIKQIQKISQLQESGQLILLGDKLYQTAMARLKEKELSLSELAQSLNITKSCLNHRLRKIMQYQMQK